MSSLNSPSLIASSGDSLREAFGKSLVELSTKYKNFVVLDADVAGGTGTHHFRKNNPGRFYQFGIAEQNMMAAASGIAATGLIPFVTTFAVFSLRAIEQARLSIAYAKRNVKIVSSHPGLDVGPDGASAQALEDLAMFRSIPNMVVISPADSYEIKLATEAIINYEGPVYMRSGRSPCPRIFDEDYDFEIGKGKIIVKGKDLTIFAIGVEVHRAIDASNKLKLDGIEARVVNLSTLKPIDVELINKCVKETGCLVTAEDHNIIGGLGGAVSEVVAQNYPCPIEFVGIHDCFGESGEPDELVEKYEISSDAIVLASKKVLARKRIIL